ncbi:plasmid mobilization protein [Streptococcus pluranimalium]
MAQINIKLSDEQKEKIVAIAKGRGVSLTQLVIGSILYKEELYTSKEDVYGKEKRAENDGERKEDRLESEAYKELCEVLKEQITQKDLQIDQLHKIIYNKDTLLIEYNTEKRHWWQFWKPSSKE